jgi:transcriptional regulator with PAS, ATPase and Fis domain
MNQGTPGPAATLFAAVEQVIDAAAQISDPLERAAALEDAGANIPALAKAIRIARAAAIREAMETRTATAVAEELGISRTRLYSVLDVR